MAFLLLGLIIAICNLGVMIADENAMEENPCPVNWIQATWVDLGCILFDSSLAYNWDEANAFCQNTEHSN